MSWSHAQVRKWRNDNPGKSRLQVITRRVVRRNIARIVDNVTRSNILLQVLKS